MVTVAHLLDVCDDPDEVGKGKAVNKRGQFRQFNAYKIILFNTQLSIDEVRNIPNLLASSQYFSTHTLSE